MSDLTGRTLRGRYRVIRRIDGGQMSDVYLASHHQHAGVRYALKVLKPQWTNHADFGQRFRNEARLLERLDHPGIVRLHDMFDDRGAVCMVLSFVEGRSLADCIAQRGAMKPAEALPIIKAVLDALDHAHQRGVVHRDVKPSNILLDTGDQPRLCDFGIAKEIGQRGMTAAGRSMGTPAYMSPEMVLSPTDVDHRSDLYAAGIVLYEMLAGRVPFLADTEEAEVLLMKDQVHKEPPDPREFKPDLESALVDVLEKALRKDPERRMQGGSEFRAAIEHAEREMAHGGRQRHRDGDSARRGRARDERPYRTVDRDLPSSTPDADYASYEYPGMAVVHVKRGMCWPALFGGPLWLLSQRLYSWAWPWLGAEIVLGTLIVVLHAQTQDRAPLLLLGLLAVFAVIWIMPAFRGNEWREQALLNEGYRLIE